MMLPFTWRKPKTRSAGGGYTDAVTAAIEARAATASANVGSTAAIEAAAGALSRAFASADVIGPGWAKDAIGPVWLAQVGRSLVREGASLSVVDIRSDGSLSLIPAAFWNFESQTQPDDTDEEAWICRATTYGPSASVTRLLNRDRLVYVRWGTSPGTRYRGQSPMGWASLTAKTQAEAEKSLGDEAAGPIAQILPVPQDGGDGGEGDPLAALKGDVAAARGKALLTETTSAGWGEGKGVAPNRDWQANRLGPQPPQAVVEMADKAFARMLAACGCPPGLFESGADGTSQREALRRWHLGTVEPLAKMLAHELTKRLETEVKLRFDSYPKDIAGRAAAFKALVTAGTDMKEAAAVSGVMLDDER